MHCKYIVNVYLNILHSTFYMYNRIMMKKEWKQIQLIVTRVQIGKIKRKYEINGKIDWKKNKNHQMIDCFVLSQGYGNKKIWLWLWFGLTWLYTYNFHKNIDSNVKRNEIKCICKLTYHFIMKYCKHIFKSIFVCENGHLWDIPMFATK